MEAQQAPAVFGPYQLVELLSCTPSARVYRADDTRHDGRSVALKLFAPRLSCDPAFRVRFHRDAGLLSALRDPHVVRVHTYGEHDGTVYLDMRLISGRSLADVRRSGVVDARRAASITAQLAEAIDAVRAGGLGVRAVDEADVLVSESDFVQLVGLGLGRVPAGLPVGAADLVGRPRARRRRWWPIAAAAVAVLLAGAVTLAVARTDPTPLPAGAVAVLAGGEEATSVAATVLDGRQVLVGTLMDGRVRSWDLATGQLVGATLPGSAELVATAVLNGQPVAVQRDTDQMVRVRRLSDGRVVADPIGAPETHRSGTVVDLPRSIRTAEPAGTPVVIMSEPADPVTFDTDARLGYQVRSLADGVPVGPLVTVPGASMPWSPLASPTATTVDGVPAVVVATDRREVHVFDMRTGAPIGTPGSTQADISVLRVGERDGAPVAVVGCADNTVRTIDLRTGHVGSVMAGHTAAVWNLLVVTAGERTVVVSVATGGEVRFWDLASGTQLGSALRDHPVGASLLTSAQLGGRAVLVASELADQGPGTTTVWDLAALMGEAAS